MKAVALILALAVITGKCTAALGLLESFFFRSNVCIFIRAFHMFPFSTGCNARAVRQADATPDSWEDTVSRFWQHISDLNGQRDGIVQNLKASQLSRELE